MTLHDLIEFFTGLDQVAVFLFFLIIPMLALLFNKLSLGVGHQPPYNRLYSMLIYLVSIPGCLSATIWVYSMTFEEKSLWQLDPIVYYLPIVSMAITLWLIKKNVQFRVLPWFGEFYELMILIFVTFMSILLIMQLEILSFKAVWHVGLVFLFLFALLRAGWERFQRLSR